MTPSHDPEFARTIDSDVVRTDHRSTTTAKPARLLSLDVLRGLTLAFMILVNAQYPYGFRELEHADWNGFTATDLVYPTFLFLIGISTVLSTAARLAKGATKTELFWHTLRRSIVLFLFGMIVNNFPYFHWSHIRYYGVLPRIAICYFFVATYYLIKPAWKDKVVAAALCLVSYWAIMRFIPVPGYGMPTHDMPINDQFGNISTWLDRQIFSASHMYQPWGDPEGIISTIPSFATALFGLLTAVWLRTTRTTAEKARGIVLAGISFLILGGLWNFEFPINKKLWTSSFALWAGGWSLLLLALFIYLVDIKRIGRGDATRADNPDHPTLWKPFLVFGTNSILAYMVSEVGESIISNIHTSHGSLKRMLYAHVQQIIPTGPWSSLTWGLLNVFVCWLIVYVFYRKRIFLKI
jgi:predicted acyltransferase